MYTDFTQMWHDQGKWVTCHWLSILRFLHHILAAQISYILMQIRNENLFTELWAIYQYRKQYKTISQKQYATSDSFPGLDHVTNDTFKQTICRAREKAWRSFHGVNHAFGVQSRLKKLINNNLNKIDFFSLIFFTILYKGYLSNMNCNLDLFWYKMVTFF